MLIIINAGHSKDGKPDPGACGNGFKEYEEALIIARLAKVKFDMYQTNIDLKILQQSGNVTSNAQLNKLVADINSLKADLMISIHLNSASAQAHGIETLYYGSSKQGLLLANNIQTSLIKNTGRTDRGVKVDTRGLAVLKRTNMPSVLTEVGFISNPQEANWIHNNHELIAESIVEGIIKYLRSQKILTENILNKQDEKKYPVIELDPIEKGVYNCSVDGELKLKENKLESCLNWIKQNYC